MIKRLNTLLFVILNLLSQSSQAQVMLFGNVTALDDSENNYVSNPFSESLDLFYAGQIGGKVSALMEFVVEHDEEANHHHVERFMIKYAFSDELQVGVGRFHSPIGYWNRQMHHGRWLYNTVERPFYLAFEDESHRDGIFPTHGTGVMFTGKLERDQSIFNYEVLVGQAPEIDSSKALSGNVDVHDRLEIPRFLESGNDPTIVLRGQLRRKLSPWAAALFLMQHEPNESGSIAEGALLDNGNVLVQQRVIGIDVQRKTDKLDFMLEAVRVMNDEQVLTLKDRTAWAYYCQFDFKPVENWTFVYRYSALHIEEEDAYFRLLEVGEQRHQVLTARYDINDNQAVKFEMDFVDGRSATVEDNNIFRVQWSFMLH